MMIVKKILAQKEEINIIETMQSDIELELPIDVSEHELELLPLAFGATEHYGPMLLSFFAKLDECSLHGRLLICVQESVFTICVILLWRRTSM